MRERDRSLSPRNTRRTRKCPRRLFACGPWTSLVRAVIGLLLGLSAFASTQAVEFNTHIRPILMQHCTSCHGGVKAAGDVSLVYRDAVEAVGKKSGRRIIVPGRPEESELIARITSTDAERRMPPADHAPALAPEKVALLRQWIQEGARWQDHWAFTPPVAPALPLVAPPRASDRRGPIDAFVLERLAREGLAPLPEAPRPALLRRVSFDLTGLPPTPEETAAFVADASPSAYERQVDRLLASPHFGERWASLWLDLARYADTKGYEKDTERQVWPYRDWLVQAFNRNLPYDRFVIEQLAGDLLPGATLDQRLATAFNRLTQVNDEGGTDDEEYRIAAVLDRVGTTWAATSAVTMNCVQCHSHPYEPIRHREFYQFLAYFNASADADLPSDHPTLRIAEAPDRRAAAWALQQEIDRLRRDVVAAGRDAAEATRWQPVPVAAATATPAVEFRLAGGELAAAGTVASNARYEVTLAVPAGSEPLTALRFEVPPDDPEKARHTPERGFIVMGLDLAVVAPDGAATPVAVGRYFPDTENFTTRFTRAVPRPSSGPSEGPPPAKARGKAKQAPEEQRDVTLEFHFAANPTLQAPRWIVAALREPLLVPAGSSLRVTVRHQRDITSKPAPVRRLRVAGSGDVRWTALGGDAALAAKVARVSEAIAELARIPGADVPVMADLPAAEGRETRLFARGNFMDKTGPALAPGMPALFPPVPAGRPANRLTMAEWFFQPGQPLTARVAVNRFWEQLFGAGIVATLEDFGSVGEPPSHPALLDWLALRFERDLRWDMKALLREIVLSATYRREARLTPELLERDPANRLLARGPRQRLTAEMVRDQALAASGLLSRKLGGPPVMPPQPAGVWQTVYNSREWVEASGADRYRRAVYTYWKRSAAYPGFLTFDLPVRDLCTARRSPTNTPLQALVTLNDVVYHEAAEALAGRAGREAGEGGVATPDATIARAFELVVSRAPTAVEAARLRRLYDEAFAAAAALPAPETADGAAVPATRLAPPARAMRDVAVAILNLDASFVR